VLVEKANPSQEALAGKSALDRLELTRGKASRKERYKKTVLDHEAVDRLLVEVFLEAHQEAPQEIIRLKVLRCAPKPYWREKSSHAQRKTGQRVNDTTTPGETISQLPIRTNFIPVLPSCEK